MFHTRSIDFLRCWKSKHELGANSATEVLINGIPWFFLRVAMFLVACNPIGSNHTPLTQSGKLAMNYGNNDLQEIFAISLCPEIKMSKTVLAVCSVPISCKDSCISRFKRFAYKRVKSPFSVWLDKVLKSLFQLRIWGQTGQDLTQQTHRNLFTIKRYFLLSMRVLFGPKSVIFLPAKPCRLTCYGNFCILKNRVYVTKLRIPWELKIKIII